MQELIERYVYLVGQNLPAKERDDIQKEIRSLIEDTLEDESQSAGRPVDEEMVVEVLKRMGRPEKVAASYLPPRYLVGPELFPYYIFVLRIVLVVVTVLAMVGLGFSLAFETMQFSGIGKAVLEVLAGLVATIFQAAAVVTLVFAVLQWAGKSKEIISSQKPWDPRGMPQVDDTQRIKIGEIIVEMVFSILLLALLNFFPHRIGIFNNNNGTWTFAPVLTDAFFSYLPFINVVFVLDLIKNSLLLYSGRRTKPIRWYAVVVSLATIALAAWMLSGPVLATLSPEAYNRLGMAMLDAETLALLNRMVNFSLRIALSVVLVVEVVELGQNLYQLLLKNRMPALPTPSE